MTPYQRLELAYWQHTEKHHDAPALSFYVQQNLAHGFVFSRPDFFVMGRPVMRDAPEALIIDNTHDFPWKDCDCWFLDALSGNMGRAWEILPWPLPWFCFGRWMKDVLGLRFYRAEVLKRLSLLLSPPEQFPYGRQIFSKPSGPAGHGASDH